MPANLTPKRIVIGQEFVSLHSFAREAIKLFEAEERPRPDGYPYICHMTEGRYGKGVGYSINWLMEEFVPGSWSTCFDRSLVSIVNTSCDVLNPRPFDRLDLLELRLYFLCRLLAQPDRVVVVPSTRIADVTSFGIDYDNTEWD